VNVLSPIDGSLPNSGQSLVNGQSLINGMSVDVEDWFQVGAFEGVIARADWDSLADRVERNCDLILDMFAQADVRATFFTLGWMAQRHPALMRRIAEAGHELASHGWDHERVFRMDADMFARDLERSRKAIEDASGVRVIGYRAPSFSIDARTPWAFEVLAEQGYAYSSSVAPVAHDHYGWREAPRFAFNPLEDSALLEIPVTTAIFARRRLAAGGGGFFRVLPYQFTRWAIGQVNGREARPAIFYFHPWEIDTDQPRIAGVGAKTRFRHYVNIDQMEQRIRRLVTDFSWGRMDDVFLPAV